MEIGPKISSLKMTRTKPKRLSEQATQVSRTDLKPSNASRLSDGSSCVSFWLCDAFVATFHVIVQPVERCHSWHRCGVDDGHMRCSNLLRLRFCIASILKSLTSPICFCVGMGVTKEKSSISVSQTLLKG